MSRLGRVRRRSRNCLIALLRICILTLTSILFLLPALSPQTDNNSDSEQRSTELLSKVAVVIPIIRSQAFDRLPSTLEQWTSRPPCLSADFQTSSRLSLVFNYDGVLSHSADVENQIRLLWDALPKQVKRCFATLDILSSNLSAAETKYPLGPCLQFQSTFGMLEEQGFSHWLQFEPDVEPVRPGWGSRLLEVTQRNIACKEWWQLGSSPMYDTQVSNILVQDGFTEDVHLNGNAVYCLNSQAFADYRQRVSRLFPHRGCVVHGTDDALAGYDHAWYRFRLKRENIEYMRGKYSYFRDDAFIRNFGPASFDIETLLRTWPDTMLVHSSYKFADRKRQMLLDQKYLTHNLTGILQTSFQKLLGRAATRSEEHFFMRVLQPFHGVAGTVLCMLSELFSLCAVTHSHDGPCTAKNISLIFPSKSEAALTANYILNFQRMPGPEALRHLCFTDFEERGIDTRWLCSMKVLDAQSGESKGSKGHSCFRMKSNNHVLVGSYRQSCSQQRYDNKEDVLTCKLNGDTLAIRHPFRCAEDISIDSAPSLVC